MKVNPFAQQIGQSRAIQLLQQAARRDRIAPAYLFVGSDGIGKSMAAKSFGELLISKVASSKEQYLNQRQRLLAGNHPDFLWVEPTYNHQGKLLTASEAAAVGLKRRASPQIRIEQIRILIQFLSRPPLEASRSVAVIEDAQRMVEPAANALLKTLEEPGRATIILIALDPDSLLPTLVSRCQLIPFATLGEEDLKRVLRQVGEEEILAHPELLAIAEGSPGKAILAYNAMKAIGSELLHQLTQPPKSPRHALELAKQIDKELDSEHQLWLIDYLQYCYWQKWHLGSLIQHLEHTRKLLLSYVQPRLTWECTLLRIFQQLNFQAA